VLKPKTFAGIVGAAPSVALATLALTIAQDGKMFAADEARSMMAGAALLSCTHTLPCKLIARWRWNVFRSTVVSLAVWFASAAAFGF
jgi:hypothetical protein